MAARRGRASCGELWRDLTWAPDVHMGQRASVDESIRRLQVRFPGGALATSPVSKTDSPPGYALLKTEPRLTTLALRSVVGVALLVTGLRRFLQPELRGPFHLESIGIPLPGMVAPLFGGFELTVGALVLLGLGVRIAVLPALTILLWELTLTAPMVAADAGLLAAVRVTGGQLFLLAGCSYLLVVGAGAHSLDLTAHRAAVTGDD